MALSAAARRRARRYTPFKQPTRPPAGMYDPALDSGERAAGRGYQDLRQDTERNIGRTQDDLGLSTGDVTRNRDQQLADLMKSRARAGEDYQTNVNDLATRYANLRDSQKDRANAAGVLGSSGFDEQSAAARGVNQAHDRAGIDTAYNRFIEDSRTSEQRVGEGADLQLGRLNLTGGRSIEDARTQEERGGRELGFYGQDVNAQRFFQAGQAGYVPPEKPANEGTRFGVTYQRQQGGSALLPSGRVVSRTGLRSILQQAARRRGVAYR